MASCAMVDNVMPRSLGRRSASWLQLLQREKARAGTAVQRWPSLKRTHNWAAAYRWNCKSLRAARLGSVGQEPKKLPNCSCKEHTHTQVLCCRCCSSAAYGGQALLSDLLAEAHVEFLRYGTGMRPRKNALFLSHRHVQKPIFSIQRIYF